MNPTQPPAETPLPRQALLWIVAAALGFATGAFPARAPAPNATPAALFDRVDIHRAAWPQIAHLNGLGRSLSIQIVRFRDRQGGSDPVFTCAEDLLRVRGIGPAKLQQIRDELYFGPPVPATATARSLQPTDTRQPQ